MTQWGQSIIDAQAVNTANSCYGLAKALEAENEQLKHELRTVLALGHTEAANQPVMRQLPL
jgi:hypothetical protein